MKCDVHNFKVLNLVINMKVAVTRIIYSACTIIASHERLGLLT